MDANSVEENGNPRLGVQDKRRLFQLLIAKVERLFYLNKFPVDMEDFALSLERPDIEAAWRLLKADADPRTLAPIHAIQVNTGKEMMLAAYPGEREDNRIFMDPNAHIHTLEMPNRFYGKVTEWTRRQLLLEQQMLRACKVIKAIVTSCNTVGQYERVSPELIGFLPDNYKLALKQMLKKSPYPAINVEPEEIETAMSTLAYASLQPEHYDESIFVPTSHWRHRSYILSKFPRSVDYEGKDCRALNI